MTDLTTLIARLEAATGPDRNLDVEISCAVDGRVLEKRGRDQKAWLYRKGSDSGRQDPGGWSYHASPSFTASVDAAIALAGRVLPGWECHLLMGGEAEVYRPGSGADEEAVFFSARHSVTAIALTIAILKAKQAEASNEDH